MEKTGRVLYQDLKKKLLRNQRTLAKIEDYWTSTVGGNYGKEFEDPNYVISAFFTTHHILLREVVKLIDENTKAE